MNKCDEISKKNDASINLNDSERRHISTCQECQQKQRLLLDMKGLLNIGERRENELFEELGRRPKTIARNKNLPIIVLASAAACLLFFFVQKKNHSPTVVDNTPTLEVEPREDKIKAESLRQLFSHESSYRQKKTRLMAHLSYRTKIKYKSKSLKAIRQRWQRKSKK